MAAKKNVAVTPAFTGRNVSLSEISQASGIGIANDERLDVFDLCLMKRELLYR